MKLLGGRGKGWAGGRASRLVLSGDAHASVEPGAVQFVQASLLLSGHLQLPVGEKWNDE